MKGKEGTTVEGIAEEQGQNKENEGMSSRGSSAENIGEDAGATSKEHRIACLPR